MLRFPTLLCLCFICTFVNAQTGDKIFNTSKVHEIRVTSTDPMFWEKLLADYDSTINTEDNIYRPAKLVIDGTTLQTVGFRIKGFTSAGAHPFKKPFRIDFNEFVKGQNYDGIKKLSLNNAAFDPSVMRDVLAFDVLRNAGVPASRTAYTRVYLNDKYLGLYIMVEQVDKEFAQSRFNNDSGNLFKCTSAYDLRFLGGNKQDYHPVMSLKTNESEDDWSGFINFVKYINQEGISEDEFNTKFPDLFDVPGFLKTLAVDVLLQNWDSYMDHGRNWYLYENTDTEKFHWIPWDYNFSFSDLHMDVMADTPQFVSTPKPLIRNLLKKEENKRQLAAFYKYILSTNFTEERLFPLIDFYEDQISDDLTADPNRDFNMEKFHRCLNEDIIIHHEDTFKTENRLEDVFFWDGMSTIPDSILNTKIIVDTTWFDKVEFETIMIDNEPVEMVQFYFFSIWDERVIGIKPFISRRIQQVEQELKALDLWDDIVISADDPKAESLTIYPNPVSRILNVEGPFDVKNTHVDVVSTDGKILSLPLIDGKIDVRGLSPGIYLLRIVTGGKSYTKRFIRQLN